MDSYLGFIEFFVVALFALAWGILELVGRRLERSGARKGTEFCSVAIRPGYLRARGIRNGSIACTTGILKRSSDRLSCIKVTGLPSNFADTTERA